MINHIFKQTWFSGKYYFREYNEVTIFWLKMKYTIEI